MRLLVTLLFLVPCLTSAHSIESTVEQEFEVEAENNQIDEIEDLQEGAQEEAERNELAALNARKKLLGLRKQKTIISRKAEKEIAQAEARRLKAEKERKRDEAEIAFIENQIHKIQKKVTATRALAQQAEIEALEVSAQKDDLEKELFELEQF